VDVSISNSCLGNDRGTPVFISGIRYWFNIFISCDAACSVRKKGQNFALNFKWSMFQAPDVIYFGLCLNI
jgi:hypothetical protein